MPNTQGIVGPQSVGDGANPILRAGRTGEQLFSEVHGRYSEQSGRGNLFFAQAIVTAPVAFSTAAGVGGPLLWNPSAKINAQILAVGYGVTVVSTVAAALGLTGGTGQISAPATTTAIDGVTNLYLGGALPTCKVYRIGTVVNAGAFLLPFGELHTGALTVDTGLMRWVDVGGMLTVPQNCWASVAASVAATTTVAQIGIVWEEVPV